MAEAESVKTQDVGTEARAELPVAKPIRIIVYPTDFSENAYRGLPYVQLLAKTFGAEVHLLHVLPTFGMDDPRYSYWVGGKFQTQAFLDEAWRRLRREQQVVKLDGAPKVVQVRLGDPPETIDRYAREVGADLIVMSTHSMAWWERLLMGSITEEALRDAPCPVLVIPAAHLEPAAG